MRLRPGFNLLQTYLSIFCLPPLSDRATVHPTTPNPAPQPNPSPTLNLLREVR